MGWWALLWSPVAAAAVWALWRTGGFDVSPLSQDEIDRLEEERRTRERNRRRHDRARRRARERRRQVV